MLQKRNTRVHVLSQQLQFEDKITVKKLTGGYLYHWFAEWVLHRDEDECGWLSSPVNPVCLLKWDTADLSVYLSGLHQLVCVLNSTIHIFLLTKSSAVFYWRKHSTNSDILMSEMSVFDSFMPADICLLTLTSVCVVFLFLCIYIHSSLIASYLPRPPAAVSLTVGDSL